MAVIHKKTIPYDTVANAVPTTGGGGGGAVTIADGANTVEGTTTDAAVDTDSNGTINAHLRGIVKRLVAAFSISTPLRVDPTGSTAQPATQSGAWDVGLLPRTSGGLDKFHLVSAGSTNATNIKASAGQVYGIVAFNLNASPRYLKFHNNSGTPTAGSGVVDTFMIPGNAAGTGFVISFPQGIAFSTGIAITLVTGITDADATGVAASEIVLQVYYK